MGKQTTNPEIYEQAAPRPLCFPQTNPAGVACCSKKAHCIVAVAIKEGKLVRPPKCESCNKECKPHGHHPDYSKPLEVKWLCQLCHRRIHAKGFSLEMKRSKERARELVASMSLLPKSGGI